MFHKVNQRLKAFTLTEILVGMALMGILCLGGFHALGLVQKQHWLYQKSTDELYGYQHLLKLIERDVQQADVVMRVEEGWICSKNQIETLYSIDQSQIIRMTNSTASVSDTFEITIQDFRSSFNNKMVEAGIVDQITFQSSYHELKQQNAFTKNYSAFDLIKFKSNEQ